MDTPANRSTEAWVCRRPCTEMIGIEGSCFFNTAAHRDSCPSGCDTSKLLSDGLKNKLYYDCFQKVLYHYSHQTRKIQTFSRKRRVRIFCFWRRAPPHNKSIRSAWPGCFSSGAVHCGCLFLCRALSPDGRVRVSAAF